MNTVYNSTEAFFHFTNEKLIFCGIKTNEITTAYICVVKKYRDFDFDDLNLVYLKHYLYKFKRIIYL